MTGLITLGILVSLLLSSLLGPGVPRTATISRPDQLATSSAADTAFPCDGPASVNYLPFVVTPPNGSNSVTPAVQGTDQWATFTKNGDLSIQTDYYTVFSENNSSLFKVTDKGGMEVLAGFPIFRGLYDYVAPHGANLLANPSFEVRTGPRSVPGWALTGRDVRVSTERSTDGAASLDFSMAATERYQRSAKSTRIVISPDTDYYISYDVLLQTSLAGGTVTISIGSFDATGSGSGTRSTILTNMASQQLNPQMNWQRVTYLWVPSPQQSSFQVNIVADAGATGHAFFDNFVVVESPRVYVRATPSQLVRLQVLGTRAAATFCGQSENIVEVAVIFTFDKNLPNLGIKTHLRYRQDRQVREERWDFEVPLEQGQILDRGLTFVDLALNSGATTGGFAPGIYQTDPLTPRLVRFGEHLSLLGGDTFEAMQTVRSPGGSATLSLFTYKDSYHPFGLVKCEPPAQGFLVAPEDIWHLFPIGPAYDSTCLLNRARRDTGQVVLGNVHLVVGSREAFLLKTRAPDGFRASLTLTEHPDNEAPGPALAIAYGTSDTSSPDFRKGGFIGNGLVWTKGVFLAGNDERGDLSNSSYRGLIDELNGAHVEIALHTPTPGADSPAVVAQALSELQRFGTRQWIDHAPTTNPEDLTVSGAVSGSQMYILDLLHGARYRYVWTMLDLNARWSYAAVFAQHRSINLLDPALPSEIMPILFRSDVLSAVPSAGGEPMYAYGTFATGWAPEKYLTQQAIDGLVSDRGLTIVHDYFSGPRSLGHTYQKVGNDFEVDLQFNAELAYIAQLQRQGVLWVPTASELFDYLLLAQQVAVEPVGHQKFRITNGHSPVHGLTLLAEYPVASAVTSYPILVDVRSNMVIIPDLAPDQSFELTILPSNP